MAIQAEKLKEWINNLNLVFKEAREYKEKDLREKIRTLKAKDESWAFLWSFKYGTIFFFTRESYSIFSKVVREYLDMFFPQQADISKLVDVFIQEINSVFIEDSKTMWSRKKMCSVLEKLKNICETQLEKATHYKVFALPNDDEFDEFYVGPIRFIKPEKLWGELSEKIDAYIFDHKAGNILYASSKEDYERYNWIACIDILKCSEVMSDKRARECIDLALNFIALFYSKQFFSFMSEGSFDFKKESDIFISEDGKLHIRIKKSFPKADSDKDPWLFHLLKKENSVLIKYFGDFIALFATFSEISMFTERFYTALQLYGEGLRDSNKSMGIVKFVIALELIVQYGRNSKIDKVLKCEKCAHEMQYEGSDLVTKRFCDRVQLLYEKKVNDKSENRKDIEKIYDIRSKIVHGEMTCGDKSVNLFHTKALDVLSVCLMHFLEKIAQIGFTSELTNEQVNDCFENWIKALDTRQVTFWA